MADEDPVILDPKAREAVHAARDAAYSVEVARQVQLENAANNAAHIAADLATEKVSSKLIDESRMSQIVEDRMRHVLTQGTEDKREAIVARIPYVCEDIREMKLTLKDIQSVIIYIPLIQKLMFGLVGMVLTAVVGAIIALVIIK